MPKRFVCEPLVACYGEGGDGEVSVTMHEPALPPAFLWRQERIVIAGTVARRRSSKVDRGDTYLKRHWYDLQTGDGRIVTVYYDRAAKRGAPHWWLYSIEDNAET